MNPKSAPVAPLTGDARLSPDLLAARTGALTSSVIRELSKRISENPEIVSFAGGMPAPATFPVEAIRNAADRILAKDAGRALQYGGTAGYAPLRELVARNLSTAQAPISPEQVFITNGSQQGLDLIGKLFIEAGAGVGVELPTYIGALQAFNPYDPDYVPLACDEGGVLPDSLAAGRPCRLLYTIPNFQNPSGRTLDAERRQHLVARAATLGTVIVEDDPYGQIRFEGESRPSLLSFNPEGVIYLGTFSKILSPGLRCGYAVVPRWLCEKFEQAKQATDLHSSMLDQMIVHEVASSESFDQHLALVREHYRRQRDLLLAALTSEFTGLATWTRPEGGMFTWLTFDDDRIDTSAMLPAALARKVAFVPGAPFFPPSQHDRNRHHMRLSFATVSPDLVGEGIARLGAAYRDYRS